MRRRCRSADLFAACSAAWSTVARAPAVSAAALLFSATGGAAPFAYITNQGSHDVSVIDLAAQRVIARVPVGRSPAGVVASSAAGRAFVSNADGKSISVIDMRSQAVIATIAAGDGPVGIDASADGKRLYAADWYKNRLLVFDAANGAPLGAIAVGRAPAGVAAHPDGGSVFVAERDDDSVAWVDTTGMAGGRPTDGVDGAGGTRTRVLARVKVGSHPFALLLDAPRQRLYALNVQSDDVSVIDLRRSLPCAGRFAVIATVKVGKAPYGAALADGGALLYVTNQHDDSVSVIDTATLAVARTLTGFGYPEGVASHADRVYVVNWMDDDVSVLDAASGRALARIATGRNSRGFGAFIGAPLVP